MTTEEFLHQLEKLGKGKFKIVQDTYYPLIRYDGQLNVCPIEYVYARTKHKSLISVVHKVDRCAKKLGLSAQDLDDIAVAADVKTLKPPVKRLRVRMLEVLGLEEE